MTLLRFDVVNGYLKMPVPESDEADSCGQCCSERLVGCPACDFAPRLRTQQYQASKLRKPTSRDIGEPGIREDSPFDAP